MNGTTICQSILETVRILVHNSLFSNAYSIGNAFTRLRKLTFLNVFFYLLNISKKAMPIHMSDFMEDFRCVGFPDVSKQALSKARRGISPEAFAELCRISAQKFYETSDSLRRWHGYLVMAIDGTLLQLPQTERNMDVFGRTKNQSGTPRAEASASALFDVLNDLIVDPWIGALNYGERKRALRHMDALACMRPDNGDVLLVMDRGYPSYEIFQEIINRGMSFVIRLGSSFSASIIKHPGLDFFVDYMPKRHKEPVRLRIVRVVLDDGTVETLATNLYSPAFTAELFRELYFLRWGEETKYYELKERIQVEEFSGSHPAAIHQDFYISIFMSNLTAILKMDADAEISQEQGSKCKKNRFQYQANRGYLISRVNKFLIKMLAGELKITDTLQKIVALSKKVVSQVQPGRKYNRKKKSGRLKHYNNKKPCL